MHPKSLSLFRSITRLKLWFVALPNLCQAFNGYISALQQPENETLRGTSEKSFNDIANRLIGGLLPRNNRTIKIDPILQRSFGFVLAAQNVQDSLHRRVSKLRFPDLCPNSPNVGWPKSPQDVHYFKFEGREGPIPTLWFGHFWHCTKQQDPVESSGSKNHPQYL